MNAPERCFEHSAAKTVIGFKRWRDLLRGMHRIVSAVSTGLTHQVSGADDAASLRRFGARALMPFIKRFFPLRLPTKMSELTQSSLGAAAAVAIVAGCSDAGFAKSDYLILDSKLPYKSVSPEPLFWMDDNRVIFEARRPEDLANNGAYPKHIFIWDTSKNVISVYREHAFNLCYHNGYIVYTQGDRTAAVGKLTLFAGELGHEQATGRFLQGQNRFTCKEHDLYGRDHGALDAAEPRLSLLDGHGYLNLEPLGPGREGPLIYFPTRDHRGIVLPLQKWQVDPIVLRYSEFANAYVLHSGYAGPQPILTDWPKDRSRLVHLLSLDGRIRTVEIPYAKWLRRAGTDFYYTSRGIFVDSSDDFGYQNPGNAGGYLINGGNVTKVIAGMLETAAVSPSGCKIALRHDPWDGKNAATVKLINLCSKGQ